MATSKLNFLVWCLATRVLSPVCVVKGGMEDCTGELQKVEQGGKPEDY